MVQCRCWWKKQKHTHSKFLKEYIKMTINLATTGYTIVTLQPQHWSKNSHL